MEKFESFSSRWGIILVGLGMAVGTGNLWRFPRIVFSEIEIFLSGNNFKPIRLEGEKQVH